MIPVFIPLCLDCKHRIIQDNMPKNKVYCKAYPNGIPNDVWKEKSKLDIDKSASCPNGYTFEHK